MKGCVYMKRLLLAEPHVELNWGRAGARCVIPPCLFLSAANLYRSRKADQSGFWCLPLLRVYAFVTVFLSIT